MSGRPKVLCRTIAVDGFDIEANLREQLNQEPGLAFIVIVVVQDFLDVFLRWFVVPIDQGSLDFFYLAWIQV
jgi:hypothetical protein